MSKGYIHSNNILYIIMLIPAINFTQLTFYTVWLLVRRLFSMSTFWHLTFYPYDFLSVDFVSGFTFSPSTFSDFDFLTLDLLPFWLFVIWLFVPFYFLSVYFFRCWLFARRLFRLLTFYYWPNVPLLYIHLPFAIWLFVRNPARSAAGGPSPPPLCPASPPLCIDSRSFWCRCTYIQMMSTLLSSQWPQQSSRPLIPIY